MRFSQIFKLLSIIIVAFAFFSTTVLSQESRDKKKEPWNGIYRDGTTILRPKDKFTSGSPNAIKGEYIVIVLSETSAEEVEAIFKEFQSKYQIELIDKEHGIWTSGLKGFGCQTDEKTARLISDDPRVDHVTENVRHISPSSALPPTQPKINSSPSAAVPESDQANAWYHLTRISTRQNNLGSFPFVPNTTYRYYRTGENVPVYIVDSGLRVSHEEFSNLSRTVVNFTGDNLSNSFDYDGHGTGVASNLAGKLLGSAKNVKLTMCRVYSSNGIGGSAAIDIAAINWIRNQIITSGLNSVVNISFAFNASLSPQSANDFQL